MNTRATAIDRIELRGLRVFGYHGVFEHERRDGQEFVVDLTIRTDISAAAASDDLTHTVDYGALADLAVEIVAGPPCNLIETVATALADRIRHLAGVLDVEVVLHKPGAPIPHRFTDVRVVTSGSRGQEAV